jgi:hypothetical protein
MSEKLPKLKIKWKQEGNKVYFKFKDEEIFFIMPKDYKLSETHPDLLKLSEYLMFSPWYDTIGDYKFSRFHGSEFGLCFSTGVDSVANMIILPKDTYLIYTERYNVDDHFLKQDNAIHMIENIDRKVIRVRTNFEIIRNLQDSNLNIGYSTAIGMGVPTVLLADYLDLGVISYGKVFDDQYFPDGIFRDYTKDYFVRQDLLNSCGLLGYYPTVGCSEVITTQIVDNSKYKDLSFSCLRGELGEQCNNCFKCFRKNLLRGKKAFVDKQSYTFINKNPPKMCTSLVYALKLRNILSKFGNLDYLKDVDVSMLNKVYSPAYDIYDLELKLFTLERLKELGFKKMNKKEENKLRKLNFIKNE